MKSFLILEDSPERLSVMVRWLYPYGYCLTVRSVQSFQEMIQTCKSFDVIFMDHDLGDAAVFGHGMMAAGIIAYEKNYDTVVIHSHNHGMADKMRAYLDDGDRRVIVHPFDHSLQWLKRIVEELKW